MKNIDLKLVGVSSEVAPSVLIDGEHVEYKKNKFGSYVINCRTEKDEAEIVFYRDLELKAKFWWLYAVISFVISIFGLLEPRYDRKCVTMNCVFKIKLAEVNEITFRFNPMTSGGKAVEIETQNEFEEIRNEYTVDRVAKKRRKILLAVKILIWIIIAVLIGYGLAKRI